MIKFGLEDFVKIGKSVVYPKGTVVSRYKGVGIMEGGTFSKLVELPKTHPLRDNGIGAFRLDKYEGSKTLQLFDTKGQYLTLGDTSDIKTLLRMAKESEFKLSVIS